MITHSFLYKEQIIFTSRTNKESYPCLFIRDSYYEGCAVIAFNPLDINFTNICVDYKTIKNKYWTDKQFISELDCFQNYLFTEAHIDYLSKFDCLSHLTHLLNQEIQ